jgi:hypothetical protein
LIFSSPLLRDDDHGEQGVGVSIAQAPPTQLAFCVSGGHPGGTTVYVHDADASHAAPASGSASGHAGGMHGGLSFSTAHPAAPHVTANIPAQAPGNVIVHACPGLLQGAPTVGSIVGQGAGDPEDPEQLPWSGCHTPPRHVNALPQPPLPA